MGASGSIEIARHMLMVFGLIMAMGTVSGVLASRLRLPDVVVFLLLGLPMLVAPLLASTIASTDPATLVPVFRTVRTVRCPPAMRT